MIGGWEEQVELDGVVLNLRDRLRHAGELVVLDLDADLGLEALQDLLIDVVVPVEDPQRAGFGGQSVAHRRVIVEQGQLDR